MTLRSAAALLLGLTLTAAAPAQYGKSSGLAPRFLNNSGYPGRDKVQRDRLEREHREREARIEGVATPPKLVNQPPPPTLFPETAPNKYFLLTQPKAFPDFQEVLRKKRAEEEGAAPGRRPAASPDRALRGGRSLGDLSSVSRDALAYLAEEQRETNVRRVVRELDERERPVTGLGLARAVLREFGAAVPETGKELLRVGRSVPIADLRAGDLVFFETSAASGNHRNVGIYFGDGTFAYPTRAGVRLGNLRAPPWATRLVEARRGR